jgi:hypothetical protein
MKLIKILLFLKMFAISVIFSSCSNPTVNLNPDHEGGLSAHYESGTATICLGPACVETNINSSK